MDPLNREIQSTGAKSSNHNAKGVEGTECCGNIVVDFDVGPNKIELSVSVD